MRDATLVCMLAYAGLRPGEALALEWRHIRERTILVEQALALGEVKETKTGQTRTVRLFGPLATDLAEWQLASGRPTEVARLPWQGRKALDRHDVPQLATTGVRPCG